MSTWRGFFIASVTAALVIALKTTRLTGVSFLIALRLRQRLLQVPADRFALAVGVGREDQRVVVLSARRRSP